MGFGPAPPGRPGRHAPAPATLILRHRFEPSIVLMHTPRSEWSIAILSSRETADVPGASVRATPDVLVNRNLPLNDMANPARIASLALHRAP